jgi:nocardicin N-oxygenase
VEAAPSSQDHLHPYPFGKGERRGCPVDIGLDPLYRQLRDQGPVARVITPSGEPAWLVLGWPEARHVLLLDGRKFSKERAARRGGLSNRPPEFITDFDGEKHLRLRKLIVQVFTAKRVTQMRPRIQTITTQLLDQMALVEGPVDLARAYALPLPVTVVADLLGFPPEVMDLFLGLSEQFLSTTAFTAQQAEDAQQLMGAFFADLIAQRRAQPTGDLLSDLVKARDDNKALNDQELINLAIALLVAGFETTFSHIGNFSYMLLTRPSLLQQLIDDPGFIPNAVEELLRYIPIASNDGLPLEAMEDVVIGDTLIRTGDLVMVGRDAAGRDPAIFDDPETISFTREEPTRHLAFGYGPHLCLGAHLARAELQIAFTGLLARFPDLRLAADPGQVEWYEGKQTRGPRELQVWLS